MNISLFGKESHSNEQESVYEYDSYREINDFSRIDTTDRKERSKIRLMDRLLKSSNRSKKENVKVHTFPPKKTHRSSINLTKISKHPSESEKPYIKNTLKKSIIVDEIGGKDNINKASKTSLNLPRVGIHQFDIS